MRRMLLISLFSATPALASGVEIRPAVELAWTPGAEDPIGAAMSLDVVVTDYGPRPMQVGGSVRFEAYSVRGSQFTVEPLMGVAFTSTHSLCGTSAPLSADLRPGLTFRTDGGPALSLATVTSVTRQPAALRMRAATAVPLTSEPRWPARTRFGPFEDTTLSVAGALVLGLDGLCPVLDGVTGSSTPPPLTRTEPRSGQQ